MVGRKEGEVLCESGLGEFLPFPFSLSSMCKSNSFVSSQRESPDERAGEKKKEKEKEI